MRALLIALAILMLGCGGKAEPAATGGTEARKGKDPNPTCPAGHFLGADDGCLKRCTAAADCAAGEVCEAIRNVAADGTKGPVLDRGCM